MNKPFLEFEQPIAELQAKIQELRMMSGDTEVNIGEEIERLRQHEQTRLPEDLDYASLNGLSNEIRAKLADVRPQTLGQASRIPGVTPAAVSLLLIHLKKRNALGDSSLAREA